MRKIVIATALVLATLSAGAQPANSTDQLFERWKRATAAKDANAYQSLFAISSDKDKAATSSQFKLRTGMKMLSAKIAPFSTYEKQYEAALQRGAKPVVSPKAWLVVEYAPMSAGDATMTETDVFLIGVKDGKYMFSS